jgi:folate-binding protein YgfZ
MVEGLRSATFNRDAVAVTGPDAVSYLQGQLSQDVAALEPGGSSWSWLLQPAGKVDALVRVTRTGPDSLLVDVDSGWGPAVVERLTRFKLRTKAELVAAQVCVLAVRGPGAGGIAAELAGRAGLPEAGGDGAPPGGDDLLAGAPALMVAALWPDGGEAADLVVRGLTTLEVGDVVGLSAAAWEAERIAAGVPAMGAELTERTIPAETGLVAVTASFTKGCYTGQELVARIDSRGGNVPRHLRRLRPATALVPGDELTNADGKVVGVVTSAAVHAGLGPVALGYVARSVTGEDTLVAAGAPVRVLRSGAGAPLGGSGTDAGD